MLRRIDTVFMMRLNTKSTQRILARQSVLHLLWPCLLAFGLGLTASAMAAQPSVPQAFAMDLRFQGDIRTLPCQLKPVVNGGEAVRMPSLPDSDDPLSLEKAVTRFSIVMQKVVSGDPCESANNFYNLQFDLDTSNERFVESSSAANSINLLKNKAIELLLYSEDWSSSRVIDFSSKQPLKIDNRRASNKSAAVKEQQINLGIRYSKPFWQAIQSNSGNQLTGIFYISLPFMVNLN